MVKNVFNELQLEREYLLGLKNKNTDTNQAYIDDTLNMIEHNIDFINNHSKGFNLENINIDNYSLLKNVDLLDLFDFLNNYYILYRDKINVSSDISFGIEIEYESLELEKIYEYFVNNNLFWDIVSDSSLNNGNEIVSPILNDSIKSWNELKIICNFLKKHNAKTIYGRTGGHFHIGLPIFHNEYNYSKFIKCYMLYEDILNRFFCGEYVNIRESAIKYAGLCKNYMMNEDNSYFYIPRTKALYTTCFSFNLFNEKNTLEFRRPNGTIEEVIWQNNINSIIKMILNINKDNFDIEYIEYEIGRDIDRILNKCDSAYDYEINIEKVLKFVDLFYDNNLDKINFLKQYFKGYELCLKRKELVKTSKFWKEKNISLV